MIFLIIKNYFLILLAISSGCLLLFFVGFYFILKSNKKKKLAILSPTPFRTQSITSRDIRAISGEDMLATQLDLARAYIETGKKQLAKKMLNHVIQQGSNIQQQEARQLLEFI